jgi:hypothetical protein
MKINILSENVILTLSSPENQKLVLKEIKEKPDNSWLKNWFGDQVFISSKIEIDDNLSFEIDKLNPESTDFVNAKKLFEGIKGITESIAFDQRLWLGLTFDRFYDYMKNRFNVERETNLNNRWFMPEKSKKRSLYRQGISMLWWFVYLTYDKNRGNPYELTEFIFNHKDILINLNFRGYSNSKDIRLSIIQAIKDFKIDGGDINKKVLFNELYKYLSFLGSVYLLDVFSKEEIYDRCYAQLVRLSNQQLE